ncbi:MAG: hypothetical protein JW809_05745 [Pirellulales bacterium]|nr:hypothetical protein [Pirellulales bacterium]
MTRRWGFWLVVIGALAAPAEAIELSQDFDSGSLDVAATTIVGGNVRLVGRKNWTDPVYANYFRWIYFRASDVNGQKPKFTISPSSCLADLWTHRFVYSYDQTEWRFFDYGGVNSSTGLYTFYNFTSFDHDDVYVAYSLPYPLSRTEEHVARVAASPFVAPTASGGGGLVVGRSAGGVDDCGRAVEEHDLFGYRITDPAATGAKQKVVLAGGNHSCETIGNHVLEGMIDFLLSDDPEAVALRGAAEFYVYPQVNPDGREAGYYRSTPENPGKDYNRFWNNPAGFTDMTAVRDAMILDTGGDVDYLIDFHGMFSPQLSDFCYVAPDDYGSPFLAALAELEPTIREVSFVGEPGMLHVWAATAAGLKAEFTCVPEFGPHAGVYEDDLDAIGANYGRALARAIVVVPEPLACVLLLTGVVAAVAPRVLHGARRENARSSPAPDRTAPRRGRVVPSAKGLR